MALATTKLTEGSVKLVVPKGSLTDPHHQLVFYNPNMEFNRSISSIALGCALPFLDGAEVLDGLCALGARGLRYLVENPKKVKRVTFGEANPHAIPFLKRNIKLNRIAKRRYEIAFGDLNMTMATSKRRYDFIEIDPFGSPVFYLETAVRRLQRKGVLSITATDMANLYGARPKPAIRHYDARPLNTEYGHELGLRILVGRVVRTAAVMDFAVRPLLSFFQGHAAKTIVLCEKGAPGADESLTSLGFVSHCVSCLYRVAGKLPNRKCANCGKEMAFAGPLYLGRLNDVGFLNAMKEENGVRHYNDRARIDSFLSTLIAENDLPAGFYDLHILSQKLGIPSPKTRDVLSGLQGKGFRATATHFSPEGVKTDAPLKEVFSVVKSGA